MGGGGAGKGMGGLGRKKQGGDGQGKAGQDKVREGMEGSIKQGRVAYLLHHGCRTIFTNTHRAELAYVLQIYATTVVTEMPGTSPISTIIFDKI